MPTLQETHHALVQNNKDPEQRGRLKLRCQGITGADYQLPDWIEPAVQMFSSKDGGASLWLPAVGSTVELITDVSDPDWDDMKGERFLQNPGFKWRPATLGKAMPLPDALKANYPESRGFVTPAGHKIILNDKGDITIEAKGGAKIMVTDSTVEVSTSGPALALPTLAEVTAITSYLASLVLYLTALTLPVSGATAGPPVAPPPPAPAAPAGTGVFRTQ